MRPLHRRRTSILILLLAGLLLGNGSCDSFGYGTPLFHFRAPRFFQLSLPGSLAFDLKLPPLAIRNSLVINLDGVPLPTGGLSNVSGGVAGSVAAPAEGTHSLSATIDVRVLFFFRAKLTAATLFDIADLDHPAECEVLNDVECLLPYPSSRFLVPAATPTGYRLALPAAGMPQLIGAPISTAPLDGLDGFSPTAQILMHFPAGVDLDASDAPRLLEARCCGQSPVPPLEDVRTLDARSLDADSPTLLLDADTGERVLHWVELDARATGNAARQVLFLRPGKSLTPGHRYIVAVRNLVDPAGDPVKPELAFRALRDRLHSTIPALEARRAHFDGIFTKLRHAGILRHELTLAFDFVVRSDEQLTSAMLAMRDDALAWVDAIAPGDASGVTMNAAYNASHVNNCAAPGQKIWRTVKGTFNGPFYQTGSINTGVGAPVLNVDASGNPVRNGVQPFNFDFAIPCSVFDPAAAPRPLLVGHGLFGDGAGMVANLGGATGLANQLPGPFPYIVGATDWRGLSSLDLIWLLVNVVGNPTTGHQLNNFPSFTARLEQGEINTLVLTRLMDSGYFNRLPEFQRTPGDPSTGVFPGAAEETYYFGVSLGGIMGLFTAALTPDIERFNIDVGAINFSLLLQRSTQFSVFETVLATVGLNDPMDTALGLGLLHEQWVTSEPAAYARHITGLVEPPLPGSPAKKILMTVAWLDKQVSNNAAEVAARTLGIPNFDGASLVRGLQQIPDAPEGASGLDSAYVIYDVGSFDVFDPAFDAVIPPLANQIPSDVCDPHARRLTIPASNQQLLAFLQPGGRIRNFCDGVCDAGTNAERPGGVSEAALCDPLP
jgi:hypothetical protein